MRISEFSVVEFGVLRNVKGKLAPRLSVIVGGNESGKTTLSRFFRYLLFADKNVNETQGKGAMSVAMDDGRTLRTELDGRQRLFGETNESMAVMQKNFLPFSAEEYESIFCVDALTNARSIFFTAGSEIGLFSNFMSLTKKLDGLERELYLPGGADSLLNELWAEINRNELQIEELKDRTVLCMELCETLEGKREALKDARLALEGNRRDLVRAELKAKARPVWLQVRYLEEKLNALGPAREMPKRWLERLKSLQDKITDLRARLNELRRKNAYESSRRHQMENNPVMSILEYDGALDSLEREMGGVLTEAEKAALSDQAESAEGFMKKELMDAAPDWSEEDLLAADLSTAAEGQIRAVRDAVLDLSRRSKKLFDDISEEERKRASLQAKITARPGSAGSHSQSADNSKFLNYHAKRELLLDLRRDVLCSDALRWEIRGEKACAELLENEIENESPIPRRTGKYMAKFLLMLLLSLSGVSVAIGVLAPIFRPYDVYVVLFCVFAMLEPVFSILISRKEHLARVAQWEAGYDRRNGALDRLDEKIVEQRQEILLIDASIEQKARILGIEVPPTLADLDEAARLLENEHNAAVDMAVDMEVMAMARKELAEDLKKCDTRLNDLKKDFSMLARGLESALKKWKDWLLRNRLDPNLPPESFDSFITGARAARSNLQSLSLIRRKLAAQREYEASLEAGMNELSAKTGLKLDKEGVLSAFASLKEARSLRARIEASLEERLVTDFESSELEKELATAVGSLRSLYREAGTDSEEGLRALSEENALRSSLESRLAELKYALAGILGRDSFDTGDSDFGGSEFFADGQTMAERASALRLAIADGDRIVEALRGEIASLEEQTKSMTSDDRIFTLLQRNEILKARVRREFHRWLSVVLLKRFAGNVAERRGKKLEPEMLKYARQFMSLMTGKDCKITADAPGEESSFAMSIEREPGLLFDETQWSSGLADQVSLSMRLAAALRSAERTESVPIVLDDILTRFDESRQRGAAEALWQASEKLQVIFFTCHRLTADIFRSRLAGEKGFSVIEIKGRDAQRAAAKKRASRRKAS